MMISRECTDLEYLELANSADRRLYYVVILTYNLLVYYKVKCRLFYICIFAILSLGICTRKMWAYLYIKTCTKMSGTVLFRVNSGKNKSNDE